MLRDNASSGPVASDKELKTLNHLRAACIEEQRNS